MAAVSLYEVNSFVTKFTNLWKAGRDACLQLVSHAGQACVTLRLGLGVFPHDKKDANEILRKKLSPSKIRWRNRHAAARVAETENVMDREGSKVNTVHDSSETEIVSDVVRDVGESLELHSSNENYVLPAGIKCDHCDFSSTWANGLKMHISSVHELKQLDKLTRKEEREVFHSTQSYWETGILPNNLQVYINALVDVEKANVNEDVKVMEENRLEELWKKMESLKANLFPP